MGKVNPLPRVAIRRATFSDSEEFLRLEAKCFGVRFNAITIYYWRPIIDYCWAFKAVVDQRIVGGTIAMPTRDRRIHLNSLFVDERWRRRGLGAKLLSRVLGLRASRGFVLDVREDNASLRDYYRKRGFKEVRVEEDYYQDGSARVIMARN